MIIQKMTIEKEEFPSSCNNCNAQNFESSYVKETKAIFALRIGCMKNCLCEDCLKQLGRMIAEIEV